MFKNAKKIVQKKNIKKLYLFQEELIQKTERKRQEKQKQNKIRRKEKTPLEKLGTKNNVEKGILF